MTKSAEASDSASSASELLCSNT